MFNSLYRIAINDLDCSIILYDSKYYPQSIFYLQQAVEKAVKSHSIFFNMLNEEELKNKIGHNPQQIYKKQVNRFSQGCIALNKDLVNYPGSQILFESSGIDFGEFASNIKQSQYEFNEFLTKNTKYNLTNEELQACLFGIENFNIEIKNMERKITEGAINDEQLTLLKEKCKDQLVSMIMSLNISDEQKKEIKDRSELLLKYLFPKKEFLGYMFKSMIKFFKISQNLFYLSVITSPHSVKSRYPENNFNPLLFYGPECPLIERLPEMHEIVKHTLQEMEILYDFILNKPNNLLALPDDVTLMAKSPGNDPYEL